MRRIAFVGITTALLCAACEQEATAPPAVEPPEAAVEPEAPMPEVASDPLTLPETSTTASIELTPAPLQIDPGDEAEPPPPVVVRAEIGSCDVREASSVCMAFTGLGWTAAAAQAECAEAPGGLFVSGTCPLDKRIGECVYRPDDDATREIVTTFYAPMEPLIAEAVCRGALRPL